MQKIKDITNRTQIRFKPLNPDLLAGIELSEKGVQNILTSCYSRFFEEKKYFFIYVTGESTEVIMIVKKEREIEGRTDITVENILPGTLLINTGIMSHKINDLLIRVDSE
jgi:hypothetical protein